MVVVVIFASAALVALAFTGLVKRERGWVGVSPALRAQLKLRAAMSRVMFAFADAILPVIRKTTRQLAAFNDALERTQR